MPQLSWFETKIGGVKNFLIAHAQSRQGNEKPLIDFFMKVTAEPYHPRRHGAYRKPDTIVLESNPEQNEVMEYAGIQFEHRCLMVDVQADDFWALVMAFSKEGHILIVDFANVPRWTDVAALQARYKIQHGNVGVDISHREEEVTRECCRHGEIVQRGQTKEWVGWIAFRGSDLPHFPWTDPKSPDPKHPQVIELPYAWPPRYGDPCKGLARNHPLRAELGGRLCPIVTWSNPTIKDEAMARFRQKAESVRDYVRRDENDPAKWNEEYARQRDSQKKVMADAKYARASPWKYVKKHNDDHGNDCYCMGLTLAKMRRWLLGTGPAAVM